jgi:hypothetical protein
MYQLGPVSTDLPVMEIQNFRCAIFVTFFLQPEATTFSSPFLEQPCHLLFVVLAGLRFSLFLFKIKVRR